MVSTHGAAPVDGEAVAVRLYAVVAAGGFRRYATYRIETAAGGVHQHRLRLHPGLHLRGVVGGAAPRLGGYDMPEALTFVWLGQALLMTCVMMGGGFEDELIERIRTGDIAVDLYRPVDLQMWWLAQDLGRAAFHLLGGRGIVPMVCGGAFAFDLALPGSPWPWLAFLVSVALGVVVSFAIRYLVALSAFWLMDGGGRGADLLPGGAVLLGDAAAVDAVPGGAAG